MTTVQKLVFPSGGFVLHKVRLIGTPRRFSAWYDEQGVLIDSCAIDSQGCEYEPTGSQKKALQHFGLNQGK